MKILLALTAAALMTACATTSTTTTTLAVKRAQKARLVVANTDEPAPPAEGPGDVPPGPAQDPNRNPGLVPSPLLRYSAASMTP